jgi:PAS domain S-box-containing protein
MEVFMQHNEKTKAQLIDELVSLRQRLTALEALETEHNQTEKALAERIKQAEAMRAVTVEITRELDLTTLLGLITRRAVDLVEAARLGVVYLWDEVTEVLTPQAWWGFGEWIGEVRLELTQGLVGAVAQQRQGLLVNDYQTSLYASSLFVERFEATAVVAEPLLYRDRLVGVIALGNDGTDLSFTIQDQEVLTLFAAQAAVAIENARLYEVVRCNRDFLQSIAENSADAIVTTDIYGCITYVSSGTEEILGYRASEVLGRHIMEYYRGGLEEAREVMQWVKTKGHVKSYETSLLAKDGRWVDINCSIALLRDASDAIVGTVGIFKDVHERKQAERALQESEEKYRHIINAAADAIITIDEQGLVCEFNRAAEWIFGFTKSELVDKSLTAIIPERFRDLHTAGLQRYLTSGCSRLSSWHNVEFPGLTKDSREIPLEISFSLMEAGGKKFLTAVLRDIAERKQDQQELHLAKEAAEEANRAKSAFLANMSHELRTPLNAIIGYSEMLHEEAEDLGQADFIPDLEKVQAAGKHLLALINDVLDLSKIEAGKMDLFLETFDVQFMIQDTVTTVQPLAEKHRNTLEIHSADHLGTMRADLTKVRQSLLNLLSNACKFTEQGTITLDTSREMVDGADWLTFRVTDTGIGMTPEQVENLFQAFTQADVSTTRKYGGTGLGLVISQRFCQLMGGDILAESAPGQGSTFIIRLPTEVATYKATVLLPADSAASEY